MKTNSEHVLSWRQRTKQRMVNAFGGECGICKYKRFIGALEFHHLESETKEKTLSGMIVNPAAWNKIVIELRKCVCLCSICHREVHGDIISVPLDIKRFDESFFEYKVAYEKELNPCPICGILKWEGQKTCSYKCAAQMARKYNWDKYNLQEMFVVKKMSQVSIAKIIGCSDAAVKKRLIKEGLRQK